MKFKIKFTKKIVGAIILFFLGFILLIGYPRQKTAENQSNSITKVKQETVINKKNKAVSNSIEKYKTPKKKRVIRTVQQPVSNNYQDEGC